MNGNIYIYTHINLFSYTHIIPHQCHLNPFAIGHGAQRAPGQAQPADPRATENLA